MTRRWGPRSRRVYGTLHPVLQEVMDYLLEHVADISLIYGYRTEKEQNLLFASGKSQLQYPRSKHNQWPSKAVDFQPYPYPRVERELWAALAYSAGIAIEHAWREHGVRLRWGGDWDQDGDLTDNNFDDLFHLEIVDDQE